MKYTISKEFHFSAAHQLSLPYDSPCNRLHGHNYAVVLKLGADKLDEHGMVVDYATTAVFEDYIKTHLDHRFLNEVLEVPSTAENIAEHLSKIAGTVYAYTGVTVLSVAVSETPKTWATYHRDTAPKRPIMYSPSMGDDNP